MNIEKTELNGVLILHNAVRQDIRSDTETVFDGLLLNDNGIVFHVKEQRLYKMEKRHTFFGIHYQTDAYPQDKIVQVISGRGIDYIVDVNDKSPTYRKWISVELDESDRKAIYIPHGYGHAFLSTEDHTWQLFTVNERFHKECAKKINYRDPAIGLELPCEAEVISDSDRNAPSL